MKFGSVSIFTSLALGTVLLLGCGQIEERNAVRSPSATSTKYQSSALVGDEAISLIKAKCASCHGQGTEFDVNDVKVIQSKAAMIAGSILDGSMPKDEPLTAEEMNIIKAWRDAGYPVTSSADSSGGKGTPTTGGGKGTPSTDGGKGTPPSGGGKSEPQKPDSPSQNDCASQSKCDPSQSNKVPLPPVKK